MSSSFLGDLVTAVIFSAVAAFSGPEGSFWLVFGKTFATSNVLGSSSDGLTEKDSA